MQKIVTLNMRKQKTRKCIILKSVLACTFMKRACIFPLTASTQEIRPNASLRSQIHLPVRTLVTIVMLNGIVAESTKRNLS